MLQINEENLEEAAAEALKDRSAGKTHICFLLRPRGRQITKHFQLWDGLIAETVGRTYYEDVPEDERNPDIVAPRTVKFLIVRCCITDVLEAQRKAAKDLSRQIATPLRVNRAVGFDGRMSTIR